MKKKTLLFITFFAFILNVSSQDSIIRDVFEKFVEDKIAYMQELIDITDEQAAQIKEVELKFLLDVNSAENCWLYKTKKRVNKLKTKKKERLKDILSLDQYIKYDAIDNKKIKKRPVWMLNK